MDVSLGLPHFVNFKTNDVRARQFAERESLVLSCKSSLDQGCSEYGLICFWALLGLFRQHPRVGHKMALSARLFSIGLTGPFLPDLVE